MKLPLLRFALVATALAVATPVFGWDKAATPQRRLEILAGAAKRADEGELASCFAPPFDGEVMRNFLKDTIEYEKNLAHLFQLVGDKFNQEGLDSLGNYAEFVSDLHFLCGTTITVGDVKQPDKDGAVIAKLSFADKDGFKGDHYLKLVKQGEDDWRVLFDQEPWPNGDVDKNFTELNKTFALWGTELENICRALQEDKIAKAAVEDKAKTARKSVANAWKVMQASREEAAQAVKDKAAAAAAAQAKKEAAAKKAADDEAARKEAEKKDAAKREALKNAPPPPPPPVAAKKKNEGDEGEGENTEAAKGPDNTGMYIVFGLLAVACLVVVGILLSKLKGEKKGGRGGGGGGRRSGRGGGGGSSSSSGDRGRGSSGRSRKKR